MATMSIVLISGSSGLIGSETAKFFSEKGLQVVGIDNDMRKYFFGADASTDWNTSQLKKNIPNYRHFNADIRDQEAIFKIFSEFKKEISIVVHTAAQPSHDWAAREPLPISP